MRRAPLGCWLVAASLLAACAGGGSPEPSARPGSAPSSVPATPPPETAPAPPPGNAPDSSDTCWSAPASPDGGRPSFEDATEAAGLVEPLLGMRAHAVAFSDVDGDGWTDVFVGTFGDRAEGEYVQRGAPGPAPDRLLLGGPLGFTEAERFPELRGRTSGAAFADLDGDGDGDLVVTRNVRRRNGPPGDAPSLVLRNEGGRFEVAAELLPGRAARGVAVLDADRDGALDVFVTVDAAQGERSALLRNDGDLVLRDVTRESGLPLDLVGYSAAAADLDGDGWDDLFVAGANRLFLAEEGGRYAEAAGSAFEVAPLGDEDVVTGVATGDLDRDGRTDLVLGPHFNSTLDQGRPQPVRLLLNRTDEPGEPRFEDVTERSGLVPLATKAPHVEVADLDNDGWPDLLTSASSAEGEEPAAFRNLGVTGGEVSFSPPSGLGSERYWVTGGAEDLDRDGTLDVLLGEFEPSEPSRLWRGRAGGHWLEVAVTGRGRGVGAVVEVFDAGHLGDVDARLGREQLVAVQGYGAGTSGIAHLGLGSVDRVDLRVTLPGGGREELTDVAVDRRLSLPDGCPSA